jgi:redox-sensitive bicupin YhaK (pirin superfamily)
MFYGFLEQPGIPSSPLPSRRLGVGYRRARSGGQHSHQVVLEEVAMAAAVLDDASAVRRIAMRTRGRSHGPITRLMSPSDLGQILKPFVFLDLFDIYRASFGGIGLHPHSGIATLTYVAEGSVRYEDTNGATGFVRAGGVEWMQAGGGVWHGGGAGNDERTRGFQLWIALPPVLELGPSTSLYLDPDAIQRDGPASILLGTYASATSEIVAPSSINYIAVQLKAGERWRYQPPEGHTVLWVAIGSGKIAVPDEFGAGDMVAFEPSNAAIAVEGRSDSWFVLGSAVPHEHELVLGSYSVHTSAHALRDSEARLAAIRSHLAKEGRL